MSIVPYCLEESETTASTRLTRLSTPFDSLSREAHKGVGLRNASKLQRCSIRRIYADIDERLNVASRRVAVSERENRHCARSACQYIAQHASPAIKSSGGVLAAFVVEAEASWHGVIQIEIRGRPPHPALDRRRASRLSCRRNQSGMIESNLTIGGRETTQLLLRFRDEAFVLLVIEFVRKRPPPHVRLHPGANRREAGFAGDAFDLGVLDTRTREERLERIRGAERVR